MAGRAKQTTEAEAIAAALAVAASPQKLESIRLCNLRDPRQRIDSLGLTPAEERIAYRSLGYSGRPTDRDLIARHIDYVFDRDPTGRMDRYSREINALYSSLEAPTAREEMRYHSRVDFFDGSRREQAISFSEVSLDFSGLMSDLRSVCRKHKRLLSPAAGDLARKVGAVARPTCEAFLVASVRHHGDNQVTFKRSTLSAGSIRCKVVIHVVQRRSSRQTRIRVV